MYGTNLPPFMAPAKRARKRSPGPSEYQIHIAVVEHLQRRAKPGVEWFHPANGEHRSKVTAARLKRMGVKRGIPDLVLAYKDKTYWLELKSLSGRPTEEQLERQSGLSAAGWYGSTCHELDRALATLEQWGLLK